MELHRKSLERNFRARLRFRFLAGNRPCADRLRMLRPSLPRNAGHQAAVAEKPEKP